MIINNLCLIIVYLCQIESLRVVDEETANALNLKPGQKLCPQCYKSTHGKVDEIETNMVDSDQEYLPAETSFDSLEKAAHSLGCLPVKSSVGKRDRISYGKRKVSQLHAAVKAKCTHALDLQTEVFESTTDDCSARSCQDINHLISLLKEKVMQATRQDKIKLLTLAPQSWTCQRTMQEFGVAEHMVKRARQLKKEKGILVDPDPK